MTNGELPPAAQSYLAVVVSLIEGLFRIWSAEAASGRLFCALTQFHGQGRIGLDGQAASVLEHLDHIPYASYDSLAYVTDISHLVYATTLLDTFLSDTTMYQFLSFPGAMGKNQQVSLRSLIDSSSRSEVLTKAAAARTRELSYLPFIARIEFLRATFGLPIDLDSNTVDALVHYSSIRNAAVHDQGIFEVLLDDSGQVRSRQKTCARHPTRLGGRDVSEALNAYEKVARIVALAVLTHTLKQGDHPVVAGLARRLTALSGGAGRSSPRDEDGVVKGSATS